MKSRKGPKDEPCGTPKFVSSVLESTFLTMGMKDEVLESLFIK